MTGLRHSSNDHATVVLESVKPPDGTTRFVDQVVTFTDPDIRFKYLRNRPITFTRCDVFHVHWPEFLVRGSTSVETALRSVLFLLFVQLLRIRKVAIVRTVHNIEPHEPGVWIEGVALRALDKHTRVRVHLNLQTGSVDAAPGPTVHIPHAHYRDRFSPHARGVAVPNRVLFAGLVRPYKGVERLISFYSDERPPADSTLRIVGRPTDPELGKKISADCADSELITARLEFVSDADLVDEVTASEIVCLPYSHIHNSGMLLVALSLNRPVLVPRSPTTQALAEEVGPGWIWLFDGELTVRELEDALIGIKAGQSAPEPRLDERDWRTIGSRYAAVFRESTRAQRGLELAGKGDAR